MQARTQCFLILVHPYSEQVTVCFGVIYKLVGVLPECPSGDEPDHVEVMLDEFFS